MVIMDMRAFMLIMIMVTTLIKMLVMMMVEIMLMMMIMILRPLKIVIIIEMPRLIILILRIWAISNRRHTIEMMIDGDFVTLFCSSKSPMPTSCARLPHGNAPRREQSSGPTATQAHKRSRQRAT